MPHSVPNLTPAGTLSNLYACDPIFLQSTARILIKDTWGRYWLQSLRGRPITPSGAYDFVTMPNGVIKLARTNTHFGYSTHLGLSKGNDVRFAGSVRFANNKRANRGTIIHWRNDSGHYLPPTFMASSAGLPLGLFLEH